MKEFRPIGGDKSCKKKAQILNRIWIKLTMLHTLLDPLTAKDFHLARQVLQRDQNQQLSSGLIEKLEFFFEFYDKQQSPK